MEQNGMEWNDNRSWAALTYVQNIQLIVKDKISVVQVHALKGVIFFEDIETVSPLSRTLPEGTATVKELLCIYGLAKDKTLVV